MPMGLDQSMVIAIQTGTRRVGIKPASEEEVPLVSFAFRPAMSAEAHLLGIVGAEFVTVELPVWRTPRLQLSIHSRKLLPAKFAACRRIGIFKVFAHLLPPAFARHRYQSRLPTTVVKMTHIRPNTPASPERCGYPEKDRDLLFEVLVFEREQPNLTQDLRQPGDYHPVDLW